jgi:hypothetical protein
MLNNYDATLTALAAFLVANAPRGADRDLIRLQDQLGRGEAPDYMHLEFKPAQDVGCTLYVRVESPEGKYDRNRIMDEAGNRWYAYAVKCEVSWASWGSGDVLTTQRRLACMTEVTRLACEVERVFSAVFHRLDATAAEIAEQEAKYKKQAAEQEVKRLAHAKGMKVGETKSVGIDSKFDLKGLGEVQVERKESGRTFKYSASAECPNLVYFMRLEA